VQIDDALSSHVDFSVSRIVRHFVPDPRGELELLICVPQLYLCKHYTGKDAFIDINVPQRASIGYEVANLV
jgi:hypothetical protein